MAAHTDVLSIGPGDQADAAARRRCAIAGVGTDLLHVHRIESAYERHGRRLVERILGLQEIKVFEARLTRQHERGMRYLATRFAAKEAFSKAIGLGMHTPMAWSRLQTLNARGGRPELYLTEPLASWYAQRFGTAHVTITDEKDLVLAFVVVEAGMSPAIPSPESVD